MKNFKRFWWIILAVTTAVALLLAVLSYSSVLDLQKANDELKNKMVGISPNQKETNSLETRSARTWENDKGNIEITKTFTGEELKTAEEALVKGIKIDDPQNDFLNISPDKSNSGGADSAENDKNTVSNPGTVSSVDVNISKSAKSTGSNPVAANFAENGKIIGSNPDVVKSDGMGENTYTDPPGYTDLKSLSIGADNNYLYLKYEFWGQFPLETPQYNNDTLLGMTAKLEQFIFTDKDGSINCAELANSVSFVKFLDNRKFEKTKCTLHQKALITPNGINEEMEIVFKTNSSEGMIYGGPGFDYIIGAYPLSLFGISSGDEVNFMSSSKTNSQMSNDIATDLLLGEKDSKIGSLIKYSLGSNKYETFELEH